MKYMTQKKLKKLLSKGITTITFTKKDGTARVLKGTLDSDYITDVAAVFQKNNKKPNKPVNLDVVSCVDVEINQWRSFRVDTVTAVEKHKDI